MQVPHAGDPYGRTNGGTGPAWPGRRASWKQPTLSEEVKDTRA
jgi:hypothetical protein